MNSSDTFDARRFAPATVRNREPICDVLRRVLPPRGLILEIASGSGEHVVFFARELPKLTWQPSDPDPQARASIAAWVRTAGAFNVRPPLDLDVGEAPWSIVRADAVICINMAHVSPWGSTLALFAGSADILPPDALLYLYGPFKRGGVHTAQTNQSFDDDLRSQNPEWGVRDMEDVIAAAAAAGFRHHETVPMPANNFSLIFRRQRPRARP
ncbi:MAG TPA: DUF938 domain-containing protein [Alphaproteobacteria bacterium]|nr:DUF938 domain-containing protein [Alphaproteobacteria bacterium]